MTTTDDAVVVDELAKSFGDVPAVRGVSFSAPKGSVLAILGPNGAGKTTTVGMLTTLRTPDSGRASVAGHDVVTEAAAVRRSIMLTGQFAALDDKLTARESLVLFARIRGMNTRAARARAVELLAQFDLEDAADRRVGTYSGGMRRRIDIACGLVVRPEVVFLDEPTTGLDPRSRQSVWSLVSELKNEGITTVLTTQYLEEADVLSDNIVVIDKGTVVAEGTARQLKERTGGSYCEVVPLDPSRLPDVHAALADLGPSPIGTDGDRLSVPASDGLGTLGEIMRRLGEAEIELADLGLRRPSLDDVFFALTGHSASQDAGAPDSQDSTAQDSGAAVSSEGASVVGASGAGAGAS